MAIENNPGRAFAPYAHSSSVNPSNSSATEHQSSDRFSVLPQAVALTPPADELMPLSMQRPFQPVLLPEMEDINPFTGASQEDRSASFRRAMPHAVSLQPPSQGSEALSATLDASPTQVRHGALPSKSDLLVGQKDFRSSTPLKTSRLPSVSELNARLGPPKTRTLLQWLLSFFVVDKSSATQKKILSHLKAYHNACNGKNGSAAMERLQRLAQELDKLDANANASPTLLKMANELRKQALNELAALETVLAQLKDGQTLPKKATLLHAIDYAREGISVKDMKRLVDTGLKLDQIKHADEILLSWKAEEAYTNSSPDYRKLVDKLQSYHDFCDNFKAVEESSGLPLQVAANLKQSALQQLQALGDMVKSFCEEKPRDLNSRGWLALQDLSKQVALEQASLGKVIGEMEQGVALPGGASLSNALAFAREGVSLKDMVRLVNSGLLPQQAAEARLLLDNERASKMVNELEKLPDEERHAYLQGFSYAEFLLLESSGLGLHAGEQFKHLGIPINRETVTMALTPAHLLNPDVIEDVLNHSAFNTVDSHNSHASYVTPEGLFHGSFRPLNSRAHDFVPHPGITEATGIDPSKPLIANRHLAAQGLARALGFDVLRDRQIGTYLNTDRFNQEQQLIVGIVEGIAPGKRAADYTRDIFAHPEVLREITKLQLLDHLTGQVQRDSLKYFIDVKQGNDGRAAVTVSGIHNEYCFGKNTTHGNDIFYETGSPGFDNFRGTKMPELIDLEMANAIQNLTQDQLTTLLKDKLSPEEVNAAIMRLESVQQHIDELQSRKRILTPEQWNRMSTELAQTYMDASNSYAVRDMGLTSLQNQ